MSKKAKQAQTADQKTEKLRALRLAHEAARKEAGIFGDRSVGEITHAETRSVYVQVWKGGRRPDPLHARSPQSAGVPAADWPVIAAWAADKEPEDFRRRMIAKDLNAAEATKIKAARIGDLRAAGETVINRDGD